MSNKKLSYLQFWRLATVFYVALSCTLLLRSNDSNFEVFERLIPVIREIVINMWLEQIVIKAGIKVQFFCNFRRKTVTFHLFSCT